MSGGLFIAVIVILVAGYRHAWRDSERVYLVRIIGEQAGREQRIRFRRAFLGNKRRLPRQIERVRIGPEIMIERNVLLENDHDVLDRRGGLGGIVVGAEHRGREQRNCGSGDRGHRLGKTIMHKILSLIRNPERRSGVSADRTHSPSFGGAPAALSCTLPLLAADEREVKTG